MMITIHGLAPKTKYQDVKILIKQECNIHDFILDNLVADSDGSKKVRLGLPDDSEGYKVMKCLNGYRMPGNFVLKVVPVGKPAVNPNVPSQDTYDSRPGYQNQPRNDYPHQPRSEYMNHPSGDYNRGQHASTGPRGANASHGSSGPHVASAPPNKSYGPGGPNSQLSQGGMDNVRPSPWAANSSGSGQWGSNTQTAAPQAPQNNFHFGSGAQQNVPPSYTQQHLGHAQHSRPEMRSFEQGRQAPPTEQTYGGYPPKANVPAVRRNLKNVDILDSGNQGPEPMHVGRYPPNQYQQDKPVTIMKDNFQGPTQYNINHPGGHQQQYAQPMASSAWPQQGHQSQQTKPQFAKSAPMPYEKSFEDRKYPQPDQARDPKNVPLSPETYKEYEKRRGFSPSRREAILRRSSPSARREEPIHRDPPGRMSDMGQRRPSPTGRIVEPMQRRVSPSGRREDPHERRYSPSRKRVSPSERRNISGHPGMRHESPHRRLSPSRRLVSPTRRDEHQIPRYSPGHHHPDKMSDKYAQDGKDVKKVRPAYEPVQSHAPNQAMYSGGYRPNIRDNVQYPAQGMRQEPPGPWQRHRDEPSAPMKKQEDDRRDSRMQMTRERMPEQGEKHYSPARKSRSPNRRDRSPLRDRYKRNSPSPRSSYSPRRSWALEKRRSPDAPPPPVWPGQSNEHARGNRPNYPEKDEKPKHQPVWETRPFKEDDLRNRRPDDRRPFDDAKLRATKDVMEREPVPQGGIGDRYQREPKFAPRAEYEDRRGDNYRRRESPDRKQRDDFNLPRRPREGEGPEDYNRRRESPRRERKQDLPKDIDKDFEDIYNRAIQFKKKAEELRKSSSKKRDDFDDDRRLLDKDREDMRQRFEEHAMRYREEALRLREREERREDRPRDDRLRDERSRDDRLRDDIPRDDRPRDERPRDDRPMIRDDSLRDERFRDKRINPEESRHVSYHPRDNQPHERDHDKVIDDNRAKRFFFPNNDVKQKRDKAIEEIADKILQRNEECKHVQGEQRQRILEELKLAVARIVYDMFGDADVSFIEVIIKYQAKYNLKDEAKILQDVIRSLPKQFRTIKRHSSETPEIPAKISRHSPSADLKQGPAPRPKLSDSNFNVNLAPPSVITMPCIGVPQPQPLMDQSIVPMMLSAPFYQSFDSLQQNLQSQVYVPKPVQPVMDFPQPVQPVLEFQQAMQPVVDMTQPALDYNLNTSPSQPSIAEDESRDGYRLYLCKDDLERITNMEADLLKDFLISQMFNATAQYEGWAPDFTLKGLQTMFRYELVTRDEGSRNWLLNLDFSDFEYFHVLVYTKEELWYERAAIWLPGHSRIKTIEPLDKLKLQNKKLEGVNIDKWKFVKKLINEKGTRLYVDMPPSSARALESHEMKLSYELQQVSVFLKAVAVDKDSFDAGLKEPQSLMTPADISEAIKNAPMPSLLNDHSLVKIILKGSKTLDLVQARKIKEVVIYNLFQYHQQDGLSRTDFVKYGLLHPNYFAILPLNQESKRWLMGCSFGKVNRQAVVVIGGEEDNTRFFKMTATVPFENQLRAAHIAERLKNSNQGVKGINFGMWKALRIKPVDRKKARYEVEIDMESLETMSTMRYQLDYLDDTGVHTVYFRSEYSQSGLEELIKKYKAEMMDSYDVANMDLESEESNSETSDDIICLD